jgi:hypothetical protein
MNINWEDKLSDTKIIVRTDTLFYNFSFSMASHKLWRCPLVRRDVCLMSGFPPLQGIPIMPGRYYPISEVLN